MKFILKCRFVLINILFFQLSLIRTIEALKCRTRENMQHHQDFYNLASVCMKSSMNMTSQMLIAKDNYPDNGDSPPTWSNINDNVNNKNYNSHINRNNYNNNFDHYQYSHSSRNENLENGHRNIGTYERSFLQNQQQTQGTRSRDSYSLNRPPLDDKRFYNDRRPNYGSFSNEGYSNSNANSDDSFGSSIMCRNRNDNYNNNNNNNDNNHYRNQHLNRNYNNYNQDYNNDNNKNNGGYRNEDMLRHYETGNLADFRNRFRRDVLIPGRKYSTAFKNLTSNGEGKDDSGTNWKSPLEDIGACIIHCIFRELKMLNNEDKVDRQLMIVLMTSGIRDSELKEFLQDSVEECFDIIDLENSDDACDFSKKLILCLEEKAKRSCEDWEIKDHNDSLQQRMNFTSSMSNFEQKTQRNDKNGNQNNHGFNNRISSFNRQL